MMETKGKWIVVDNDVYQRLKDLGQKGESFNDIIRRLLETYEPRAAPKEERESGVNTKPDDPNSSERWSDAKEMSEHRWERQARNAP